MHSQNMYLNTVFFKVRERLQQINGYNTVANIHNTNSMKFIMWVSRFDLNNQQYDKLWT